MARTCEGCIPGPKDLRLADILGVALSDLCFNGPRSLTDTINTQPALYTMNRPPAALAVFEDELRCRRYSLGEGAHGVSGAPVSRRLRLGGNVAVDEQADSAPRAMRRAGWTRDRARLWLRYKGPREGQLVISGDSRRGTGALAAERGAKKVVPLAVSVASHSPLMESITAEFRQVVGRTPFTPPAVIVIGNVHAAPLLTPDDIRAELDAQLTSTVRLTESVQAMRQLG
jgi:[acyl-carrier-protein] S-malonyltransferase